MPAVEGIYEAKLSTTFASVEEAVKEMREKIGKSKTVRINSVPISLLSKLAPFFKGKDVKIILPLGEKPTDELKTLGELAVTKSRIFKDYKGINANVGSIYLSDRVYDVAWTKDRILEVDTMEYERCVKCMWDMFETSWKHSRK